MINLTNNDIITFNIYRKMLATLSNTLFLDTPSNGFKLIANHILVAHTSHRMSLTPGCSHLSVKESHFWFFRIETHQKF